MLDVEPQLAAARPGLILITDKGFAGRDTEADLAARGHHAAAAFPQGRGRPPRRAAAQDPSASSSNRSTTPSKASSTSKPTAGAPSRASPSGSPSASWPWPPRSGTTTKPAQPVTRSLIAYDH